MLRLVPPRRVPARPLRVAVLCSSRAPGVVTLVRRTEELNDAIVRGRNGRAGVCRAVADPSVARHGRRVAAGHGGPAYRFVGCITSDAGCRDAEPLERLGVPVLQHDIHGFYALLRQPLRDHQTRRAYDARTREMLRALRPDLVLLSGYLYVLTDVLLEAFPDRILNAHDGDLALLDEDGLPRYRGLHSTRDAVFAGETETRSTVHLVEQQVDVGPILVRSWPFPTHPMLQSASAAGATDILKAYAYAQREWMMLEAWPRLLDAGIQLFADGRLRRVAGRLLVDGREGGIELAKPRDAVTPIGAAGADPGVPPIGAPGADPGLPPIGAAGADPGLPPIGAAGVVAGRGAVAEGRVAFAEPRIVR